MACIINAGFELGCKDSTGGIRNIWVANHSDVTTYTESADGTITGVTSFSAQTYFQIEFPNENGDFGEVGTHNIQGTNFWTQAINVIFNKRTADSRNLLLLMAQAEMSVVIQDQNDVYMLAGRKNGINLSSSNSTAGREYGDLSGIEISLEGKEPATAPFMSASAFASLNFG